MRPDVATLRFAAVPRTGLLVDALLVAAGAGLVALAAQVEIHLGFTPVPITGQTFAVLVVGAGLGSLRGLASLGLYLLVGMAGAPVYAGGEGGTEWVRGATGGYLVGFIVAAAVTGYLAEQRWDRRLGSAIGAMFLGNAIIYSFGLPWLAHEIHTDFQGTLEAGLYPFVFGDFLKLCLAGVALPSAWKLIDRVRR
jgi:biotin transport system substrate-specific component